MTTRTRELLAEIERLEQVNQRWAQSWQSIVTANTEAWTDNVRLLWRAAAALGVVLDTAPNVKVVEAPQFSRGVRQRIAGVCGTADHVQNGPAGKLPAPPPREKENA